MTIKSNSLDPRSFTPDLVSRAVGALVGQAVGDALGAFAEFGAPGQFGQRFPSPVLTGTGEMVGGGLLGWEPGEFTDDTQMAVALAESILAFGGKFDPAHTFDRFVAWAKGAHDIGSTTAAALRFGKPWHEAAEAGHAMTGRSGGNGGVMRVVPVGIAGVRWGRIDTLWIAFDQARLTHFDPTVGVGAMVVADLVRSAIIDGTLDAHPHIKVQSYTFLPNVPKESTDIYAALLGKKWSPFTHDGPSNGEASTCVAQAVWAVRNTSSFADAVVAAIELGGDTDTVAAVTGAIAGAVYGLQGIPVRWVSALNGSLRRPDGSIATYGAMGLHDLARELLGLTPATRTEPEAPYGPRVVTTAKSGAGVLAANLEGARLTPASTAVVSMCIVDDRFTDRAHRREVYMRDEEGPLQNPNLAFAVREAVDAIEAFTAEGRDVVVHCHGGRSRTGLVLKAWYMRHFGVTHSEAHAWLHSIWPLYQVYNRTFWDFLEHEWTDEVLGGSGKAGK
jgi:ADP-ribosyl-[dinitrogen reductase] hydrolase